MSRGPGFGIQLGLLYAILCQCVFSVVPPPTNLSVVCHNFKNVLYWNYSGAVQQPTFTVNLKSYEGNPQKVNTSQTLLDISSYSSEAFDHYVVSVTALVGQEISESDTVKFTYSTDYYDGKTHRCTLDFPAVNASVHKDVMEVFFKHPFAFYTKDSLRDEFPYSITLNQEKTSQECYEDEFEYLCNVKVHVNQSVAGQCVELKFEGKILSIPLQSYRNVCVPQPEPASAKTELIAAFLCGGITFLFIVLVILWFIYKNFSKIPKVPTILRNIVTRPYSAPYSQPESPPVSSMTSATHTPILVDDFPNESLLVFPETSSCTKSDTLVNTEVEEPAPYEEEYDSSECFGKSSDYDSPKCLLEMSPGDFPEGYGPRPAIL